MSKPWTQEERLILKKYYNVESLDDLLKRLPGRTRKAVYGKVHKLRKAKWSFSRKRDNV